MSVAEFFRWLADAHGINFSVFYDRADGIRFLKGIWATTWISVVCIVASTALGIAGAWLRGQKSRWIRYAVTGYVEFFRNTPPLVQLYFFYFAIGSLLPLAHDATGNPAPLVTNAGWAIISFSLYAAAFNIEIFRSGIEAVPTATVEAAESLGMTRTQALFRVVLPLAFRISLPAFGNNLVNLVKTTTLAYAIAVPETLYVAAGIWSDQFNVREMMNVVLVVYLVLIALLVWLLNRWERAMRLPGFGQA